MKTACLLFFECAFYSITFAQDGALDPTFGNNGLVMTTLLPGIDSGGDALAIQNDGKVLVGGWVGDFSISEFCLARYTMDGTLDPSFGSGGAVFTAVGTNTDDHIQSIAVQNDGKIVVAGKGNYSYIVARYNSDGSIDSTLDGDGILYTGLPVLGYPENTLAVQDDGKIIVVGNYFNGTDDDIAVLRYNTDGTPDTSFDLDGIVTQDIAGLWQTGWGVRLQQDGKIVVGTGLFLGTPDYCLVRFNTDGSLDLTFDTDGYATYDFGGLNDIFQELEIGADGKIVMVGYSTDNFGVPSLSIARCNTDGSLDPTFDSDGKVNTPYGSGPYVAPVIDNDGKILVAVVNSYDFDVARFNVDGSFDTSFDGDGKLTTDFGDQDESKAIGIYSNGKIVVAGMGYTGTNNTICLARYNSGMSSISTHETDRFLVYPNPTNGYIRISLDSYSENVTIKLLSSSGQVLQEVENSNSDFVDLDFSTQQCGIYFLEISNGSEMKRLKLVKL